MQPPMKTYVEFIEPDRNDPAGRSTVVEVKDRDISKLNIPARCDIFYFFDSPAHNTTVAAAQDEQYNISRFHIVADKLLTRDEAKKMISNTLNTAQRAQMQWDIKLQQNEIFALTRTFNIEPVRKDSIVIDAAKKQLYPKPVPEIAHHAGGKPEDNMKLSRPVVVPKDPARFKLKPKPPKP
jgi:polyhydroxyalkanoate synthesis regulator phasin